MLAGGTLQRRNLEPSLLEEVQQFIGQLDIRLVDFIDQKHPRPRKWQKGRTQGPQGDEILCGEGGSWLLRFPQSIKGFIAIQALRHLAAWSDWPAQDPAQPQLMGDGVGKAGFAGAWCAGD